MSRLAKILLCVLGGLIVVPLIIFIVLSFWFARRGAVTTKQLLLNQVNSFAIPASCFEASRHFTSAGVDTNSQWSVQYKCDTTAGQIHDAIISNLKSLGYSVDSDDSLGNEPAQNFVSYYFTLSNILTVHDQVFAAYYIAPYNFQLPNAQRAALANQHSDGFTLTLIRTSAPKFEPQSAH